MHKIKDSQAIFQNRIIHKANWMTMVVFMRLLFFAVTGVTLIARESRPNASHLATEKNCYCCYRFHCECAFANEWAHIIIVIWSILCDVFCFRSWNCFRLLTCSLVCLFICLFLNVFLSSVVELSPNRHWNVQLKIK